jgi:hypothetical protein
MPLFGKKCENISLEKTLLVIAVLATINIAVASILYVYANLLNEFISPVILSVLLVMVEICSLWYFFDQFGYYLFSKPNAKITLRDDYKGKSIDEQIKAYESAHGNQN